jgi:hypothetical protein
VGALSEAVRNELLDAVFRNDSYANPAVYVKLHTGDPGAAGTANPAANTTRQQGTFGSAAASGAITNTSAIEWTNVPNAETYTWVSLWSASSGGTFLGSDDLSSPAIMSVGDTFRMPIGELDAALA